MESYFFQKYIGFPEEQQKLARLSLKLTEDERSQEFYNESQYLDVDRTRILLCYPRVHSYPKCRNGNSAGVTNCNDDRIGRKLRLSTAPSLPPEKLGWMR